MTAALFDMAGKVAMITGSSPGQCIIVDGGVTIADPGG